jgi:environmental stress-induced protein Ves
MNVILLKKHQFQNSVWSGGVSTQLYVSPLWASYAERNFDIRISTAKVEVDKSMFTSLPGVHRKLMILEGEITISHENHYVKHLNQFDVDTFEGNWKTSAVGTCTDFNVMTTGKLKSELFVLQIALNARYNFNLDKQWKTLILYGLAGNVNIGINAHVYQLKTGNLFVVNNIDTGYKFPLIANEDSKIIVTIIS